MNIFARIRGLYKRRRGIRKFFLVGGTAIVLLFVLVVVSAEITSQPPFCKTCHYMEPFYESWRASEHKDITCVKCHFPPGLAGTVRGKLEGIVQVVNYVSQSYIRRRPWAEISDESCLQSGCHDTRLLTGRVLFKEGIHFDHTPHLTELRRGKKLRCTSCHSQIVQGSHIAVTAETCYLCHFKKDPGMEMSLYTRLSDCKTCHRWEDVPPASMAKYRYDHTEVVKRGLECTRCHGGTIVGDGAVPKERCFSCHWDQARLSQYANTEFLHQMHIAQHKIECLNCHLNIQHKVQRIDANASTECTGCHQGSHDAQVKLFSGQGGKEVENAPSPMFKSGLTCAACHIFHESVNSGNVRKAGPQSCESCHGKGFRKLMEQWQESTQAKLDELNNIYKDAVDSLQHLRNHRRAETKRLLEDAHYNIHLVEVGKSVHNIEFAEKLLAASYENIKRAVRLVAPKYVVPAFKGTSEYIPSECASCHFGINELSVQAYGVIFPHDQHVVKNKISCETCHSNVRRHGELVIAKEDCSSCHHRKTANADCQKCHSLEAEIYSGTYAGLSQPNVMQASVGCTDCHLADRQVVKPAKSVCLNCHDKGYDEKMASWQQDIRKQTDQIKQLTLSLKSVNLTPENRQTWEKTKMLVEGVTRGSASGVHNYDLVRNILARAEKALLQISISH